MGTFDGPGLRLVVFLQGCNFQCLYCANPDTIPIGKGGKLIEEAEVLRRAISERPFFGKRGGITFSGGEPTVQAQALALVLLSITSLFALGVVSDLLVAGLMVLARRRQLSIQRMLGWGWAARHGRVLVAWVLIATAGLACMRLGGAGDVSLAIGGATLALDAAIFFILIRMYERRRVIVTERGA